MIRIGAVISHLFNLTLPFFCKTFRLDFMGICEITFVGQEGEVDLSEVLDGKRFETYRGDCGIKSSVLVLILQNGRTMYEMK